MGVDAFMLNSGTPNARIQINSSDGVFVVNVELPPPSIDSLEEEPQHFKVSLHLLAMQLCEPSVAFNGDRLKVIYVRWLDYGYPMPQEVVSLHVLQTFKFVFLS